MSSDPNDITQLLIDLQQGKSNAADKLVPLVYQELRRLAAHYMRGEREGHTLQTTALVHEAYLRLTRIEEMNWRNRAHFFAIAAQLMRRILVDHARAHRAEKRGGQKTDLNLDEALTVSYSRPDDFLALDEALDRLAEIDPRQSRIVELRFFGGLSEEETGQVLGISDRTVKREWKIAKAWLFDQLHR